MNVTTVQLDAIEFNDRHGHFPNRPNEHFPNKYSDTHDRNDRSFLMPKQPSNAFEMGKNFAEVEAKV